MEFKNSYISLMCSDCGLHLILSTIINEETFTYAFINCLVKNFLFYNLNIQVSHSSDNFNLIMVFTYEQMPENYAKLSFLRRFLSKTLECKSCDESKIRNIYEMEKHLSIHKKDLKSMKCLRCPASFFYEETLR